MPRISEVAGLTGFAGIYGHRPELWEAFRIQLAALWEFGRIDAVTKDLCRLKSASLNGCRF